MRTVVTRTWGTGEVEELEGVEYHMAMAALNLLDQASITLVNETNPDRTNTIERKEVEE